MKEKQEEEKQGQKTQGGITQERKMISGADTHVERCLTSFLNREIKIKTK